MRIAVIPARGGSKRIPMKNIRSFCGLPMIGHTINLVKSLGLFDEVIVSTDSQEIADVALSYHAQVPFLRPEELSGDFVGTAPVMSHAVRYLQRKYQDLEAVCCIYATAALMSKEDLASGLIHLNQTGVNFAFSAGRFPSAVYRGFSINENGGVQMLFPLHSDTRSQDLPVTYFDAGQFYWGKPQAFEQELPIFKDYSRIIQVPRWRCQDIDTEDDWAFAEYLWRFREAK